MADYEAAFEDVMRYMPADVSDIDSESKIKRFFRQHDRRNVMSSRFLDELARTRGAQEIIDSNTPQQRRETQRTLVTRAEQNRQRTQTEKRQLDNEGKKVVGTVTLKSGERRNVFINSEGETVVRDTKGNNRLVVNGKNTGRFAKK